MTLGEIAQLAGIVGTFLTVMIAIGGLVFQMGRLSARVSGLEVWRGSLRGDMHEISDSIKSVEVRLGTLQTTVEERTERRAFPRGAGVPT